MSTVGDRSNTVGDNHHGAGPVRAPPCSPGGATLPIVTLGHENSKESHDLLWSKLCYITENWLFPASVAVALITVSGRVREVLA
jgi:hypothetical protein